MFWGRYLIENFENYPEEDPRFVFHPLEQFYSFFRVFAFVVIFIIRKERWKTPGLVLEPSKKYTQKVDQTFHISQAALDLKSCDSEPIQLVVEYENSNFVLATLSKKANIFQVPLDLIFKTGDQVSFRTIGNGKVHLSGYHVLEDLDSMIMNGEEESDIEEIEEITKAKGKRKKPTPNTAGGKKAKLNDTNEDESDDDEFDEGDDEDEDSEDMYEENIVAGKKANKKKQKMSSSLSMDDDDEEEDEEDDEMEDEDDDDDDEEEEDYENFDFEGDDSDEMSSNEIDSSTKKKKNKAEAKKAPQTPNGVELKGKDKSAQKLNKSLNKATPGKDIKTPKSENKQKNAKQGNMDGTPQRKNAEGQKKEEKSPKSPKSEGSPQKRVLEGGVISEEIKLGNGAVAKPGKMANVYYVGTLASTKKEFDSVQSGGGFKFRIGRNEVIKGWDIGINGMKVGGKRKLTIPPHLAYGSKGSPPVIPPNSTLVFTVELRGIS